MKTGEVYKWSTAKAAGYALREKYHLYICDPDWQTDHIFLFISSDGYYESYKIANPPYVFLTKSESYISTNKIVEYKIAELSNIGQPVGFIAPRDMSALKQAVSASYSMETGHINRIVSALSAAGF